MKSVCFTCIFLTIVLLNPLAAQFWKKQNVDFLTPTQGWEIRIVNDAVAWTWGRGGDSTVTDGWQNSFKKYSFARTVNGGEKWTTGTIPLPGILGDLTSFSAVSDSIAWVSYVESLNNDFGSIRSRVYKTSNAGKDWVEGNVIIGNNWVDNIHFFDSKNGVIIADPSAKEFNIYTTIDGGQTWQKVNGANIPDAVDNDEYGVQNVFTTQGDHIWFNTYYNRVYYSKDKGNKWEVWSAPEKANGLGLQMASDELKNVYYTTDDFDTEKFQIFRRNLNETTWTDITPTNNDLWVRGICAVPGTNSLIMTLRQDTKTRISNNRGNSWIVIDSADTNYKGFLTFLNAKTGYTDQLPQTYSDPTRFIFKYSGSPLSGLLSQEIIDVDISAFPNPTTDRINVTMKSQNTDDYWVLINDINGNLLYKKVLNHTDKILEMVETSQYPNGVYTITISNKVGVKSLKFIKN